MPLRLSAVLGILALVAACEQGGGIAQSPVVDPEPGETTAEAVTAPTDGIDTEVGVE